MRGVNEAVSPARPFRLIVTEGGTGGHTYPALTAVRTLRARLATGGGTLEVLWIGTPQGLEARVAPSEGIAFTTVATGKIRRSADPRILSRWPARRTSGTWPGYRSA